MNRNRICLVTAFHLASNPRVVKEADALSRAGWEVRVVYGDHYPPARPLDAAILARRTWQADAVDGCPTVRTLGARLRQQLLLSLFRRGFPRNWWSAARAVHPEHGKLVVTACGTDAALFIGHGLAGLAAARDAASRTGTSFAFDAEDFHSAETTRVQTDRAWRHATEMIERTALPSAAWITAASPLIGAAYEQRYRLPRKPRPLLNVFPLDLAPERPPPPPSPSEPLRLYWFSQTVGPGRGLEQIIAILLELPRRVCLSLRGTVSPDYRRRLLDLVSGPARNLTLNLLPPAPADEMVRLAAEHHIGLSLELREPGNRDLCLTNKIFTYLLAGLPVWCSETSAQLALLPSLPNALLPLDLDNRQNSVERLGGWLAAPDRIRNASSEAWEASHCRYNWDQEQQILLELVSQHLGTDSPSGSRPIDPQYAG